MFYDLPSKEQAPYSAAPERPILDPVPDFGTLSVVNDIYVDREAENLDEILSSNQGQSIPEAEDLDSSRDIPYYTYDEHMVGSPDTKYGLIWYASLGNRLTQLIYPEIVDFALINDDVSLTFRHYPLSEDDIDWRAAQLSECIAEDLGNDAFWNYLGNILQSDHSNSQIVEASTELGLSEERAQRCSKDTEDITIFGKVLEDKKHAVLMGEISHSPTLVFVNHETKELRFIDRAERGEFLERVLQAMRE